MNLIKQIEFFDPININAAVHVIGVGAIGSHVAEQLARMGLPAMTLWDFDTVDEHNIPNQLYGHGDIGFPKVDMLAAQLLNINPDILIRKRKRWDPSLPLNGYVFLCVDNITVRQQVVDTYMYTNTVKGIFDFRMRLTDAQHYAGVPGNEKEMKNLRATMEFTEEEAKAATPVSACGSSLAVLPTIKMVTAVGVANFMNLVKTGDLKTMILIDAFEPSVQAFSAR